METKKCINCGETKELIKFEKRKGKRGNTCHSCRGKYKANLSGDWTRSLSKFMSQRKRDNEKLIKDKDVNPKYLRDLFEQQNGKCYWLGIELDTTRKDALRTPSVDRLNNSKGYIRDNIVLTSRFANLGRQTATVTEFKTFIENHIK